MPNCKTAQSFGSLRLDKVAVLQFCRHLKKPACSIRNVLYSEKCSCFYAINKDDNKTTNIKDVDALHHQRDTKLLRSLSPKTFHGKERALYPGCYQPTQRAAKQRTATQTLWRPQCRNLALQLRQGGELTNHLAPKQDLHIFCQG